MKAFEIFQNFVDEMRSTSSQLNKIEILKKYESTLDSDLLYFVYHPNYQYHVTSKTINKNSDSTKIKKLNWKAKIKLSIGLKKFCSFI